MQKIIQTIFFTFIFINGYSLYEIKLNDDTLTKIIIENTTNKSFRIQKEISSNLVFEGYDSKKLIDTIVIYSRTSFRIIFSTLDSTRQNVYNTFILHPGETIYLKKLPFGVFPFSNQGKERNDELLFFVKMQESVGNFEGLLTYIPHKRKESLLLLKKVQDIYIQRLNFLAEYKESNGISAKFEESIKKVFFYRQYTEYLDYCKLDGILNKELLNSLEIKRFINFFLQRENDPNSVYYNEAMFWVARLIYTEDTDSLGFYNNAKLHLNGKTLETVLYKILDLNVKNPKIGELIDDFLTICKSNALKKKVKEDYGQYLETNLLIDISKYEQKNITLLYNLKTNQILSWDKLIKVEGIKYLDFWATWCGGCRQAIPFSKKLQQEYLQKGVKVIFISLDENQGAWVKISRKEGIPDENSYLMLNPNETFIKLKYNISSIPRYMIIDKNGKVTNSDAPNPFEHKVNKSLDELLRQ